MATEASLSSETYTIIHSPLGTFLNNETSFKEKNVELRIEIFSTLQLIRVSTPFFRNSNCIDLINLSVPPLNV